MAVPEIVSVTPLRVLVVQRDASSDSLLSALMGGFEEVWTFLRTANARTGRNVAIYRGVTESSLEVGVEVGGSLPPLPAGFSIVSTPSGKVARFSYSGPYDRIPAIRQHLRSQLPAHSLEGTAWDAYNGWSQDPRKLRAEMYYLLKG